MIEQLINGLSIGAVYALFAVGFSIIFSTMQILNLAQGVYATYGAMLTYGGLTLLGLPFPVAMIAGIVGGGLLAVLIDQVGFEPLRRRGISLIGAIIASVGMWIAFREIASIATHGSPVGLPPGAYPSGVFEIGSVTILRSQIMVLVLTAVVVPCVFLLLRKTRIGAAIRAVGFDQKTAEIVGVNPRIMIISAAMLSGCITALAGILLAGNQSFNFELGDALLLQGFAAVVIGGMGDIRGAAVGGILIGIVQTFSATYISAGFQDAITFGLVLIVLLWMPRGIIRTADVARV